MNSSPISSLNSSAWIAIRRGLHLARQSAACAELVEAAGHAGEVGEHRVAHRRGHFVVGQRVEPDVDDAAKVDHGRPVEHRAPVGRIVELGREQRGRATGGELLHQRQQRRHQLVEVALLVVERRGERVGDRVVELLAPRVLHQAHCPRAARLQALVEVLLVDGQRPQLVAPA
jgi:hypothetical protein